MTNPTVDNLQTLSQQRRVGVRELVAFCEAVFGRLGVAVDDARLVSEVLVDADLRGIDTHGVWMLSTYVEQLRAGGINARPDVRLVDDGGAVAVMEGDAGPGQVVAVRAMHVAMEKAAALGVGCVAVRNSNHFGAAGYYAALAARAGFIGYCVSNGGCGGRVLAPWGGATALLGNNPQAWAIPTHRSPIVVDLSHSVVSYQRIAQAASRNERIPLGWALTETGEPTDDPVAALAGSLVPIAEHKGYALALAIEIIAGILPQGAIGPDWSRDVPASMPRKQGHLLFAIDVERLCPLETFRARVDELVDHLRASALRPEVERIHVPGEIEEQKRAERLEHGIPLWTELEARLSAVADVCGVARIGESAEYPPLPSVF